MERRFCFAVLAMAFASMPTSAQVNSWTNATSSYWEFQTNWSLGVLPNQSQSVYITNAGFKAVAIGTNTAQTFPHSMQIQDLHIAAAPDSLNVLLMNFSGFQVPLQTTSLSVGSNASVVVQSSRLEAGNITLDGGNFNHGDFSQVQVTGQVQIATGTFQGSGAYYLTSGTLSINSGLAMGGFSGLGKFIQYGGVNHIGGIIYADEYQHSYSLLVDLQGEYDIYGGQLTATNGILVGSGDYADLASFYQYGGSINADIAVNGNYILTGGNITGHMQVVFQNSFQRVDASFLQTGGTNHAISLYLGDPNRFGGRAFYTLSNGVVQVDSSVALNGGQFSQYNGLHTIVSNLVVRSTEGSYDINDAHYLLAGGTLSAGGLTAQSASFNQTGGSNLIAGDVAIVGVPPPQSGPPQVVSYTLSGGHLSARNLTVNAGYYSGFRQTGGSNQLTEKLMLQGVSPEAYYYTLEGGTLTVKDIYVANGAFFQHINGAIIHSGLLTLSQGEWRAAAASQSLGPLQLTGGSSNNNSTITFPGGASTLRLANSSAQPWDSAAILYINNWHGSTSGGGATQLYFGFNSSGLTPQQLAQIRFALSGGPYPAQILATGEVVPVAPPSLQFARNGGTMTLTWPSGWFLQSATNVTGPYNDVSGATNPWPVPMTSPQQFFRLRQ